MSTVNQKEYLKKYLSLGNEPGKKKKRKKKPLATSDRVKIIDDDIDIAGFSAAVEADLHGLTEDAPQIVGVIDERPLELRISDYRDSDLWKQVGDDNTARINATSSERGNMDQREDLANTKMVLENVDSVEDSSPSKYSDEYSPPRKRNQSGESSSTKSYKEKNYDVYSTQRSTRYKETSPRIRGDDEEDLRRYRNASPEGSPPRRNKAEDISPPRRRREDSNSPYRRNKSKNIDRSPVRRNKEYHDISPPRRNAKDDTSPVGRIRRDSDENVERQNKDRTPAKRNKDDDISPPRKSRRDQNGSSFRTGRSRYTDRSPVRRNKFDNTSPPRRSFRDNISPIRRNNRGSDTYSGRKNIDRSLIRRNKGDDDVSPFRRNVRNDQSPIRRNRGGSDVSSERRNRSRSPARRNKNHDISPPGRNTKDDVNSFRRSKGSSDSPSRRHKRDSNMSPPRRSGNDASPSRSSSVPHNKEDYDKSKLNRMDKRDNEEGQSKKVNFGKDLSPNQTKSEKCKESPSKPRISRWSDDIPAENKVLHIDRKSGLQRANELIEQNDLLRNIAGFSGGNAAPIVRDRKTGKIRDFKKEAEEAQKTQEKDDEMKAKYDRWGKGLKQVEEATEKFSSEQHEMNKPLARYADDEDLEKHLKEMERDGDPMLDYLRKKKRKKDVELGKPIKLQFEGEFMPNRYGIRPGHRWDGVDRSNGYEKKWFDVMNSRRAQQEDAYKWSTEDMHLRPLSLMIQSSSGLHRVVVVSDPEDAESKDEETSIITTITR